ncbi:arylesterase [Thalassotalea maritima]|uniref:arylesterase n=1 Tax=Thalassotalea maritima TaxID=3242416 RepID=UPI003526DA6C
MLKKLSLIVVVIITFTLSQTVLAHNSILLLGDSLSASYGMEQKQGWVHLLNQQLEQDNASYRLVNASISGETTGGGLARLDNILASNDIDVLLIELGGNDGLRGFPPKLIKNNLLQIISKAQQQNIRVWLSQVKIPPNYGVRYNQMFEQVFVDVAEQTGVTLLPFFIESVATQDGLMQNDGIHPNVEAQPILADEMRSIIEAAL